MVRPFLKKHTLLWLYAVALLATVFIFQNCAPARLSENWKNLSSTALLTKNLCQKPGASCATDFGSGTCENFTEPVSNSTILICRETACKEGNRIQSLSNELAICLPDRNFLKLASNGLDKVILGLSPLPVFLAMSSDQTGIQSRTSLKAVSGSCPANATWAPFQRAINPWTHIVRGQVVPVQPGYNFIQLTAQQLQEMQGCDWHSCVESDQGLRSCLTLVSTIGPIAQNPPAPPKPPTPSPIETPAPSPATCSESTRPAASSVTATCSSLGPAFTNGTYTESVSYTCNTSTLQWTESRLSTKNQCQSPLTKFSSLQNVNGVVQVPAGVTAFIDQDIDVSELRINGTLVCGLNSSVSLKAETIYVNGLFECGNEGNSFNGKLTISLKRNASIVPQTGLQLNGPWNEAQAETHRQRLASHSASTVGFRALIVTGQLKLFGRTKIQMARLNQTLQPGDQTITLDRDVDWFVGDEIAIAPTSFQFTEHEKFTITSISGRQVTLNQTASYLHYGGSPEIFNATFGVQFKLDQRAEVVNLSRNIKIEPHDYQAPYEQIKPEEESSEPGGHVMVHQLGRAFISSVEFYKMGHAGIMGRYPFHWHNIGDGSGQFIKNSSIHRSFQRCITVHGTRNTVVEGNTCYDFRGHGIFLEDGNETGNVIQNNIGIAAKLPFGSKILLSSDDRAQSVDLRFPAVSVFWISHPQNTVINNIAAGSVGTGFWNSFEAPLLSIPTTRFSNNIAHTTLVGHTWDGARQDNQNSRNPNNHSDRKVDMAHYAPTTIPTFSGLVAYKNHQAGLYFRGSTVIFDQNLMADNGWSYFLAFNQKVRNSVIVGQSQNRTALSPRHAGVILYDGPFELENIDFHNFHEQSAQTGSPGNLSPIPFYAIGGMEKLTNITKGIRFYPDLKYKVLNEKYINDPWIDKHLSNSIRDLDGSLTGIPGGLLVSSGGQTFTTQAGCSSSTVFIGFNVCNSTTEIGKFRMVSADYGGPAHVFLPFKLRRVSDGADSHTEAELDEVRAQKMMNAKLNIFTNQNYEVILSGNYPSKNNESFFTYYAERGSRMSPVIKIRGYGAYCRLNRGSAVNSLYALAQATDTAYFSSGSSFYMKLKAENLFHSVREGISLSTEFASSEYYLSCTEDYNVASDLVGWDKISAPQPLPTTAVRGYIDGVDANGWFTGWACFARSSYTMELHVYAGGAAGAGGSIVGIIHANQTSEPAVAAACEDPTMVGHRFFFKNTNPQHAGKKFYLHAINDVTNPLITNSGVFSFPQTF